MKNKLADNSAHRVIEFQLNTIEQLKQKNKCLASENHHMKAVLTRADKIISLYGDKYNELTVQLDNKSKSIKRKIDKMIKLIRRGDKT